MNYSEPLISIIILNWNGYEDTSECIISLRKIAYKNYKIIVVDNGSVQEDYLLLKKSKETNHYYIKVNITQAQTVTI